MKAIAWGLVVIAAGAAAAVTGPIKVEWPAVKRTAIITLPIEPYYAVPPGPERAAPPVTVSEGTEVTFEPVTVEGDTITRWEKDYQTIATGPRLVLRSVTAADSGRYRAVVTAQGSPWWSLTTNAAALLVTSDGPRLQNTSTRVRVGAGQGAVLHGFVIEPGPTRILLLVRGVGPSLRPYGVDDALARPALRLLDAQGQVIAPAASPTDEYTTLPTVEDASRSVGAFPLQAGDVARLYYVSAGAYTAELRAEDGGTGTALLEIYAVPLPPPPRFGWPQ